MTLPVDLAHWEEELALFPRELAKELLPLMGPISRAIGRFTTREMRGLGELDGVDAIARRGSYERLLISEWLLAEEMPDEFVRRAASGEHMFSRLAHKQPSSRERCVAVFDSGPEQIGSPRIAQLAILLVLARRARDANIDFDWSYAPGTRWDCIVDEASIRAFLQARTGVTATMDDFESQRSDMEGEAWAIGSAGVEQLDAKSWSTIVIEDVIDLDRRALCVKVARRARRVALELPLPADAVCAQLLRDPFRQASAEPSALSVSRGAQFSVTNGRRLIIGDGDRVLSWGIPTSAKGAAGKPRTLEISGRLLAVGASGRQTTAITLEGGVLFEHRPSGKREIGTVTGEIREGTLGCVVGTNGSFFASGELFSTSPDHRQRGPHWREPMRLVLGDASIGFFDVFRHADDYSVIRYAGPRANPPHNKLERFDVPIMFGRFVANHVFFAGPWDRSWKVLTFDMTPGSPTAPASDRSKPSIHLLDAPSGTEVIGLHSQVGKGPSLVILESDHRTFATVGKSHAATIAKASDDIDFTCKPHVSTSGRGHIAWRTVSGWIEVACIERQEIVMRVAPRD